MYALPKQEQERLQAELKPGEAIVWVGQPNPMLRMRSGFGAWLFFAPWTAFSIFWIMGASGFKWPDFSSGWNWFPLFGAPFLLIGLAGLSTPYWQRRSSRMTIYAITNQRAISIEGRINSYTVTSFPPRSIKEIIRRQHGEKLGDLLFASRFYRDSDGDRHQLDTGFFGIQEPRSVERLLEELVSRARTTNSLKADVVDA